VLEFKNNLWELRNRVGIGLSYRPPKIHRQADSIPGFLITSKELCHEMYVTLFTSRGKGLNKDRGRVLNFTNAHPSEKFFFFANLGAAENFKNLPRSFVMP
jgi:hypothetical protein